MHEPLPQYILGYLLAIVTIGTAIYDHLILKLIWIFWCLGYPFTEIFYFCNLENDTTAICIYWITSDFFIEKDRGSSLSFSVEEGYIIPYRPIGHHARAIELILIQVECMSECIAEAFVLDKLASFILACYILIGIFAEIARAVGSCYRNEWSYVPLALSWMLTVEWLEIE